MTAAESVLSVCTSHTVNTSTQALVHRFDGPGHTPSSAVQYLTAFLSCTGQVKRESNPSLCCTSCCCSHQLSSWPSSFAGHCISLRRQRLWVWWVQQQCQCICKCHQHQQRQVIACSMRKHTNSWKVTFTEKASLEQQFVQVLYKLDVALHILELEVRSSFACSFQRCFSEYLRRVCPSQVKREYISSSFGKCMLRNSKCFFVNMCNKS